HFRAYSPERASRPSFGDRGAATSTPPAASSSTRPSSCSSEPRKTLSKSRLLAHATSRRPSSLGERNVIVTDNTGDLPVSTFVLPKCHELCLAHLFGAIVPRVMEAMGSDLDGAIPVDGVNLQGPGHQVASHFAA